ncbi:MAG: extracellular solute-binding protein [Lachnospiraceae bacterium]|nr:extracellular solute-binding protein [Lachnospiraceae bacterium]
MQKKKVFLIGAAILVGGCLLFCGVRAQKQKSRMREEALNTRQEVSLTAFVQQSTTTESGIWQGWGAQKLYEDTNIKLELYPTGDAVEKKLMQYISAGTMPDIIGFRDLNQAQMAMDAGVLLPLEQYSEKLPSIFKTKAYENAISYYRENDNNGSGSLYIMPTSIGPVSYNAYNWVPLLQWGTYKEIGEPKIETLEDYLDVVEQMVAKKPVTDTGEKVYGFSLFTDWDKYSALEIASLSYFYGIDTEYVSSLMETNVITKETNSILSEDSFYKRALKFYFMANQRGLLDPDSMTQTYSKLENKFSQGRVMFSWFSWLTGTYNSVSSGNVNNEENADGYASVLASDMKIYEAPDQVIGRNWYFAISKNCKNIDKACEFLNWLYDPEVESYLYNGPEGSVWEYDKKGEPYVTEEGWNIINRQSEDLMPGEQAGSFLDGTYAFNAIGMQASTIMEDGYPISYRYWPSTLSNDKTLMEKEVLGRMESETLAEYLYEKNMIAKSTIAVNMIPALTNDMESQISRIGEVVRNYSWKMVYAADEEEFESLWASLVQETSELGMGQVEQYYQSAWETALKKAEQYE